MQNQITAEEVIKVLNRALNSDRKALSQLVSTRVECNKELAEDPTIQVWAKDGKYLVGLLGIINGLFGIDERGFGPIAAIIQEGSDVVDEFTATNGCKCR